MRIKGRTAMITVVALAVTLTTTGAASAFAAEADSSAASGASSGASRAVPMTNGFDSRISEASDQDLLVLLLTGTGPVAEAHPELPAELGFSARPMNVNVDGLALVTDAFIERYPAFSNVWAPAIRSGDPIKINDGLNGFMMDFIDFVEHDEVFSDYREAASARSHTARASGNLVWVWNVAVVANAAVVATTVGVAATVAAAAMAIALVGGVFVAYLDDVEGATSSMDMDRLRGNVVSALAS